MFGSFECRPSSILQPIIVTALLWRNSRTLQLIVSRRAPHGVLNLSNPSLMGDNRNERHHMDKNVRRGKCLNL